MYSRQDLVDTAKDDLGPISKGRQLAKYVRQLYTSGAKVYTKDMLFDLEYELGSEYTGYSIRIRCMNGAYKVEDLPASPKYVPLEGKIYITMLSIDEMISRAETAFTTGLFKDDENCTPEDQQTIVTCPIKIVMRQSNAAPYPLDMLELAWRVGWLNWGVNPVHKALQRSIDALGPRMPEISKIICLGLGPLGGFKGDDRLYERAEDGLPRYRNITQHMFACTLARALAQHYKRSSFPLLVSDPEYTEHDKKILSKNGMKVLGGFGALALSQIDRKTLILSFSPSFPIKQVIADVTMPAAIIWDQSLPTTLASEGNFESCSPHVRKLCGEYDEHVICEEPMRFGRISMYTRKTMIENLAKAMETEIEPPKLNRDTELESNAMNASDMSDTVIVDYESDHEWVVLE